MEIYLLRHAIAVSRGTPGYLNDDRPLTQEGIEKMERGAKGIIRLVSHFDVILTSPLIRAHQTADIVAKAMSCESKVEMCKPLIQGGAVKPVLSCLAKYKEADKILLVGHEPDMGYLASVLLGSEESVIEFKKGSLCRIDILQISSKEPGKLIWHLAPKQLRSLAKGK